MGSNPRDAIVCDASTAENLFACLGFLECKLPCCGPTMIPCRDQFDGEMVSLRVCELICCSHMVVHKFIQASDGCVLGMDDFGTFACQSSIDAQLMVTN